MDVSPFDGPPQVFRGAATSSGQRSSDTNLPILDAPVPPSYFVRSGGANVLMSVVHMILTRSL